MSDLFTRPQLKAASLRRGLSPTLWNQAPLAQVSIGGLDQGFGFIDDFLAFDDASARWLLTQASAGTVAMDVAAKGGVLLLDSNSTTNNQGVQIQMGGAIAASSFIPSAASKIYYEARVKIADIGSTTCQMFAGLAEVDASVFASAANTTANHIGFEAINTTAMGIHSEKAGTRSSTASVHTVVDDDYVKLGFVVDGLTKITPFVNGVSQTAITSEIPILGMTPTFVCHSSGTTDPILHVDWVACYQEENIAN
jgi:hypothetical protein